MRGQLDDYRRNCELRLLIVEGRYDPPVSADVRQDWVRLPLSRTDLCARAATLRARAGVPPAPVVDPSGVVRYGSSSVATSPIETLLIGRLAVDFESLVLREALRACLPNPSEGTRNAIDLHIMRLRRRLAPLGLAIRTAWGHGYVLEPGRSEQVHPRPAHPPVGRVIALARGSGPASDHRAPACQGELSPQGEIRID